MVSTDQQPATPIVNLLLAALMIGVSLVVMTGSSAWLDGLQLDRERSSALRVFGHVFAHDHAGLLVANLIALLAFGNAVEGRLGSALYAALFAVCAALGAQGWSLLSSAPSLTGATGPALGMAAAFLVLFPQAGVPLLVPRVTVAVLVGWGISLVVAAVALAHGSVPWWVCVPALAAHFVARLHDSLGGWLAAGNGDTAAPFGLATVTLPAWIAIPILLVGYAALVALGVLEQLGAGVGGALAGGATTLALAGAGLVRGSPPARAPRRLARRRDPRLRGRLPWDPLLPPPDAADER